jgi:hypothetical protein
MSGNTRVYIAQLKCPQKHCVLAISGEYESFDAAAILAYRLGRMMSELVGHKMLNHECGICKATDLNVTIGRTPFRSMAEAEPHLRQCEEDQRASAEWLKRSRQ